VFQPIDDYEHPLLYLPGTGIASQEIAIYKKPTELQIVWTIKEITPIT
jgi:hypothetical protein